MAKTVKAKTVAKKVRKVPAKDATDKFGTNLRKEYDNSSVTARKIIAVFGTECSVEYPDDMRHITWYHNDNKYEAVEIGTGWRFHRNDAIITENASFVKGLDDCIDAAIVDE